MRKLVTLGALMALTTSQFSSATHLIDEFPSGNPTPEATAAMRRALLPASFIIMSVESNLKVKLDCSPEFVYRAASTSAAVKAFKSELKGWTDTGLHTVPGGRGIAFSHPKNKKVLAIGSISPDNMYALLKCNVIR